MMFKKIKLLASKDYKNKPEVELNVEKCRVD